MRCAHPVTPQTFISHPLAFIMHFPPAARLVCVETNPGPTCNRWRTHCNYKRINDCENRAARAERRDWVRAILPLKCQICQQPANEIWYIHKEEKCRGCQTALCPQCANTVNDGYCNTCYVAPPPPVPNGIIVNSMELEAAEDKLLESIEHIDDGNPSTAKYHIQVALSTIYRMRKNAPAARLVGVETNPGPNSILSSIKLDIKETKQDKILAKRAALKIKKRVAMTPATRAYFFKAKSATFRREGTHLCVRGKALDGTEYYEKVLFLTKAEVLEKVDDLVTNEALLQAPVLFWHVLKYYGSLSAVPRLVSSI
jgi:hypothetical protein